MKHTIVISFLFYWAITILLQFPKESLLTGNLYKYKYYIDRYHYQNWSFFAPPPQSNYEILYYFNDLEAGKVVKVNILDNIHGNIKKNFPFNDSDIQMHYIFFVHANNLVEKMPKIYDLFSMYNSEKNKSLNNEKVTKKDITNYLLKDRDYLFFINHARKIKEKLNSKSKVNFRFEIHSHDINKFKDRSKPTRKTYDNYLFKSKEIELS